MKKFIFLLIILTSNLASSEVIECRQYLISTKTITGNMTFDAAPTDKFFYMDYFYKNNSDNKWTLVDLKFQKNLKTIVTKKNNQLKKNLKSLSKLKRDITAEDIQEAYMLDSFFLELDDMPFNEMIEFWNENRSMISQGAEGLAELILDLKNTREKEYREKINKSGEILVFNKVIKNDNSTILFFSDGLTKIETEIFYNNNNPYKITTNSSGIMGDTEYDTLFEGDCQNSASLNNETSSGNTNNIKQKLKDLKQFFEDELITQDEYDAKRKQILDEM